VTVMATIDTLKSHFAFLAGSQGFISEADYHIACHGITNDAILNELAEWLADKSYNLVKGVGPQYQKEIMERVKNPNVRDVKDTKHRTHKNKDKFQKSKKTHVDVDNAPLNSKEAPVLKAHASFHLNKVIEDMQEFEDEFFPAWKTWKVALSSDNEFLALLASIELTAQDFSNYEQAQRSIMQLIESSANEIPEDAYIDHTALQGEFLKIDPDAKLPINQRITNAISRIYDPKVLSEIFSALYRGIQSGFETRPVSPESQTPTTPAESMPSGTRMIEFESGPSGLETASTKMRPVRKKNIAKIASTVARVGYIDKERMKIQFANGTKFLAYIAETPLQKAAGLEVFESLDAADGLLFPFEEEGSATFHMGSVQFPIDIIFLMEAPNGLEVGKVIANIQPGSPDWWSYDKTAAVLEVVGGKCAEHGITIGSICAISKRIEAAALPPEYNLSLPVVAGEHDIIELFKLLSEYQDGQGDPLYAVQSRQSPNNISLHELEAIEDLLDDITIGMYMPGYPHGQLAPGEAPMGVQEDEEYTEEQAGALRDMSIAEAWLPVIREILSENSPVEEEYE